MSAPRLAWSLCGLAMVLVLTGPVLLTVAVPGAFIYQLAFSAVQISTAVVGAVVASRLPKNAVGWILLSIGTALGLSNTASTYGALGTRTSTGPLPADNITAWVGSWSFVPVVFGGVMFLLYVFPDGRFMSVTWRRLAQVSAVIIACATIVDALLPGRLDDATEIENPVAATGRLAEVVTTAQGITDPLALPAFGLAAAALVVRFRRSRGVERQQLKWISSALVVLAVSLGLTAGVPGLAGKVTFFLALFSLAAMPVAIGVAVLRYRLYDIDLVINRALVYGALTAMLAGTYLGSVLLLQLALRTVTQGSGLAVAASTLATAALVRPARSRIQAVVDRRFFRRKYDAARTLEAFGARLRDQVDLDTLTTELRAVVADTMQPAHVSLWTRERVA